MLREIQENREIQARFAEREPERALIDARLQKWLRGGSYACVNGPIHALGLPRDPYRGWTHIMVQCVEYTPGHRDRWRFRVRDCGVFRKDDLLADIEDLMQKPPGWSRAFFENIHANMDSWSAAKPWRNQSIPVNVMYFGAGLQCSIKTSTWLAFYVSGRH